jgi:hypothetical protein
MAFVVARPPLQIACRSDIPPFVLGLFEKDEAEVRSKGLSDPRSCQKFTLAAS